MNLNLPLPASPRLFVQLVSLLSDVFRIQILRIRGYPSANAYKSNVDVFPMECIQRQHKRALGRLYHRK